MPKKRNAENAGLPARWAKKHGAYYFRVPKGLESYWDGKGWFRLGTTLTEAYRAWAERAERTDRMYTVGQLLDRYVMEVVPTKEPATQAYNKIAIPNLRSVFGNLPLADITPQMIYKYVDKRSVKTRNANGRLVGGKVAAMREAEVLSHAYTKAVEWGEIARHPFKNEVRMKNPKPRDRYVQDWEIEECLNLDSKRKAGSVLAIQAYIRLKIMTGMDTKTLLTLTVSDMTEDGIQIARSKVAKSSGKQTIYLWTPELRQAVEDAKAARPTISPYLFCNRDGKGYYDEATARYDGWDSMWGRFMDRVLTETKVRERFTAHDLRAKAASDATSEEEARKLLSHASVETTRRIYRRKAERVTPVALPKKSAGNGAE